MCNLYLKNKRKRSLHLCVQNNTKEALPNMFCILTRRFINIISFDRSDFSPTWTRVRGETRQALFNLRSVHGPTKPSRQRDERVKKFHQFCLWPFTIATEWKCATDVVCSGFFLRLDDPTGTLTRRRCFNEALTHSRVQPVPSLQPWTPW